MQSKLYLNNNNNNNIIIIIIIIASRSFVILIGKNNSILNTNIAKCVSLNS